MNEKEYNILKECEAFIKDRAGLQSEEIADQERALRRMNNFWDDDNKREWRRMKRHNLSFSKFNVWTDAISSPFVKSPYHIELQPRIDELQEVINSFEHDLGTKMAFRQAIKRATSCGAGFVAIGVKDGVPTIEFVQNQGSIVWDDSDITPSLEKMQKCAIVKWISKATAETEYGWDRTDRTLNLSGVTRWGDDEKKVPLVMYYRLNGATCNLYLICGQSVQTYVIPTSRIPVARFAGWQVYGSTGISYQGVVQRLYDLVLSENIAFSQMVERSSRTLKPKMAMSMEAMKDLAGPLSKVESDESLIVPYRLAGGAPTMLQEHFQTDDLTSLISNVRNLQQDSLGIPLTGIQADKTATEVMLQQTNSESNVEEIYMNAEMAVRHISNCIIEIVCGEKMDFQLENGPSVITLAAKERQELGVVATMVPDNLKPLIASRIADTLNNDEGKSLAEDIRANYGEIRTSVTDSGTVVNELAQTKNLLNETISIADDQKAQIEKLNQTIADLQGQILKMELAQINNDSATEIQMAELKLDNKQKDVQNSIKVAELQAKIADNERKNEIAEQKNVIEAFK